MIGEGVKWNGRKKREFIDWFQNQLMNTLSDRAKLDFKWDKLIEQYRTDNRSIISDVPFVGASSIHYPLTAVHFEPVYADFMQTMHIPADFWTVMPLRPDTVDTAKPLQSFVSVIEKNYVKMREVNARAFIDLIILGTAIWRDDIIYNVKNVPTYDESGEVKRSIRVTFKPSIKHVPIRDFFIPANAITIDPDAVGGAQWVAHRFDLTIGQFRERVSTESPYYPPYDQEAVRKVEKHQRDYAGEDTPVAADEYTPWSNPKVRLYEVWVRFDADDDGIEEDIVVLWHHETASILRATYNPYLHGKRPFASATYMPSFGFYGYGIGEADDWAQAALTRLINEAINNVTLANLRMIAAPIGSNISPDEALYAGKIFFTSPGERIDTIQLGEVYPSIFNLIGTISQMAEQRTSVSEIRQGDIANLPSRTPASTVMSILQEGKKKFDMIMSNMRSGAMSDLGQRLVQNLVQISRDDMRYIFMAQQILGPEDGARVAEVLTGPIYDIEESYGIFMTATSSQVNKELEKQSFLNMAQVSAQLFYPQLMQYAQALAQSGNQEILMKTVQAAYSGTLELFKRLLEVHDVQNKEAFLPL